jgi:alkaline phosphatase
MRNRLRPATMIAIVALTIAAMFAAVVTVSPSSSRAGPAPDPPPTNVILFIGDGMGPAEMDLARGLSASGRLLLDDIEWTGSMMIDSTSLDGVTDSAAGATALATGQETWNGWLSMGPPIDNGVPTVFETVLEVAEENGMATGLVSNTSINAATPAAFGAHVPDRDMDLEITEWMAAQDIEALFSGSWSEDGLLTELDGVTNVSRLKELKPYLDGRLDWPEKMYGFFGNMAYPLDRDEEEVVRKQPTLAQMTSAAIGVLESDDGFFLMVEQATIDYGGHSRDPGWVGADVTDLDGAVMAAYDWAREPGHGNTLILVTADHETGGLQLTDETDYDAIGLQTATTEWMWGLIKRSKTAGTVRNVLEEYAGIENLDAWEIALVLANKEMGISDVLAGRDGVTWGWSGTDEGDHTDTPLEVRAWGHGAAAFNMPGLPPNEYIGQQLLTAVGN